MVKKISKDSADIAVKELEVRLNQLEQELNALDEEIGTEKVSKRQDLAGQIYEVRTSLNEIKKAHAPKVKSQSACSV